MSALNYDIERPNEAVHEIQRALHNTESFVENKQTAFKLRVQSVVTCTMSDVTQEMPVAEEEWDESKYEAALAHFEGLQDKVSSRTTTI